MIAELLSDDLETIEARKREIGEKEWQRAEERARSRIAQLGAESARDGRPTLAGIPVRIGDRPQFVTLARALTAPTASPSLVATPASSPAQIALALVLAVIVFALFVYARS